MEQAEPYSGIMLDALYGALAADPLVRSAWLGGSRARGEADAYSDVDLAIEVDEWTPERLGGLWLGGQRSTLAGEPFFHGVLADGTILDVRLGPPWEGHLRIEADPLPPRLLWRSPRGRRSTFG